MFATVHQAWQIAVSVVRASHEGGSSLAYSPTRGNMRRHAAAMTSLSQPRNGTFQHHRPEVELCSGVSARARVDEDLIQHLKPVGSEDIQANPPVDRSMVVD